MPETQAFDKFQDALKSVDALLELESAFTDPPTPADIHHVRALRASVAVLLIASFEYYVRSSISEVLSPFSISPPRVPFERLPEKLRVNGVFLPLEHAMKGPHYSAGKERYEKLPGVRQVCMLISQGCIGIDGVAETRSNIDAGTLHSLCDKIGLENVFDKIYVDFCKMWKKQETKTFIRDKLEEIVGKRHAVAHTANATNLSRSDIALYRKFINVLARCIDTRLRDHIRQIR